MKGYELKNRIVMWLLLALIISIVYTLVVFVTDVLFYGTDVFKQGLGFGDFFAAYGEITDWWFANRSAVSMNDTMKLGLPALGGVVLFGMIIFAMRAPLQDFKLFKPKETLHGDAKWASEKEIKAAGLRSKKGMLVGQTGRGYLIADGYQHSLLFAPTGSGKGVGFVIPNLLYWEESLICHDIKLENWEITSGYREREMGQDVYLWNPASPDGITHCYNPLEFVSEKMGQMVDDVQKISNLLLPEQEFWQNEARSLFVGVALYLLCVPEKTKSFGEVVRTLRSDDVVYNLAVVLDTLGKQIHPIAYMNIAAFLQKADKERSGVISTLNSSLELWANPLIDTATASSDFDFHYFKKKATTVYVGLTPDNIERLMPLMQIFYQQASQIMTKHMPRDDEPLGVLFMMDEFPTLGNMVQFKSGIAYFRGYHLRLFLIIQDTEQLKDHYEEAGMNSFLSNATYRITFAANNVETANLISQLIGNKTVKQVSRNSPVFLDLNPASRSKHVSEIQRALLLPQEVIGLPRDEQIILVESSPPIKTKKIFYYKDPFFTKRLMDPNHVPTQEPYDPAKKKEEEEAKKKAEEEAKAKEEEEARKKEEEENKAKAAAAPAEDNAAEEEFDPFSFDDDPFSFDDDPFAPPKEDTAESAEKSDAETSETEEVAAADKAEEDEVFDPFAEDDDDPFSFDDDPFDPFADDDTDESKEEKQETAEAAVPDQQPEAEPESKPAEDTSLQGSLSLDDAITSEAPLISEAPQENNPFAKEEPAADETLSAPVADTSPVGEEEDIFAAAAPTIAMDEQGDTAGDGSDASGNIMGPAADEDSIDDELAALLRGENSEDT